MSSVSGVPLGENVTDTTPLTLPAPVAWPNSASVRPPSALPSRPAVSCQSPFSEPELMCSIPAWASIEAPTPPDSGPKLTPALASALPWRPPPVDVEVRYLLGSEPWFGAPDAPVMSSNRPVIVLPKIGTDPAVELTRSWAPRPSAFPWEMLLKALWPFDQLGNVHVSLWSP